MTLMTIVYVTDMAASTAFYTALGAEVSLTNRTRTWAEFKVGDAILALHASSELPAERACGLDLSFNSTEPLETLVQSFKQAAIPLYREITDEAFGRSLVVKDPDGLSIQINEHDPELYT